MKATFIVRGAIHEHKRGFGSRSCKACLLEFFFKLTFIFAYELFMVLQAGGSSVITYVVHCT